MAEPQAGARPPAPFSPFSEAVGGPSAHDPPAPFSPAEMARRRERVWALARSAGCDEVVVHGANRSGSAVPWLTGWPVTREAALVTAPGDPGVLFVQFRNHVPLARERAADVDVRWGGPSTAAAVVAELARRSPRRRRIGLVGDVPFGFRDVVADRFGPPVDLTDGYVAARLVKSDEEVAHLRHGARLSDLALDGLVRALRPGRTDHELIDAIERSYVPAGGTTHIHYLGITSMDAPQRCVPAQLPFGHVVRGGDVVVTELSAAFRGYPGQVLRTLTVGREPTPLYRELHDVAAEVFARIVGLLRPGVTCKEVVEEARLITDAGYTLCDDLLHGFGGGYLPPVIGRPDDPTPDLVFEAGMTVVVQPNVITPDERAGVQTGELVLVTPDGAESLHAAPPGLLVVAAEDADGA